MGISLLHRNCSYQRYIRFSICNVTEQTSIAADQLTWALQCKAGAARKPRVYSENGQAPRGGGNCARPRFRIARLSGRHPQQRTRGLRPTAEPRAGVADERSAGDGPGRMLGGVHNYEEARHMPGLAGCCE